MRLVSPKYRLTFKRLHAIKSHKVELFITTAVRTSDPAWVKWLLTVRFQSLDGELGHGFQKSNLIFHWVSIRYPGWYSLNACSCDGVGKIFIYASYYFSFIQSAMALQLFVGPWPLVQFLNLFRQQVGLLGNGVSPSQGRYLHTELHKHRIHAHTDIHALSRIRTHDPSVRASEDSSCLRSRGHCDRLLLLVLSKSVPCLSVQISITANYFWPREHWSW
jgi:hypothetical protein